MPKKISWFVSGLLLSLVILFIFSTFGLNKQILLSSSIPYSASILSGIDMSSNSYLNSIKDIASFELVVIFGIFIGSLLTSIFFTKSFKLSIVPKMWRDKRGDSIFKRVFLSFIAGFVMTISVLVAVQSSVSSLLFSGANLSISALVFIVLCAISSLVVGRIFYKNAKES